MALNFPSSPVVGQVYQRWTWNGSAWVPTQTVAVPMLPIAGGNITGNLGVAGTTTLAGTLTAAGATSLDTLQVNSTADFLDGVTIDGDDAATKPWVDQQIAAGSLWQGTWAAAANVPDLTNVGLQTNGFTWAVTLADPTAPFVIPATPVLPGLNGQTVYNGDHIIWSTTASAFQIVPGSSLSLAEGQDMFVGKTGDTMTGALTLPADPTANLQASTKQYVDNNLPPVRVYPIVNFGLVTTPAAATSYENRATIPGWTLADRNLIFLSGRMQCGNADTEFMLNINGLGPYPVLFAGVEHFGKKARNARQQWRGQTNTVWGWPNSYISRQGQVMGVTPQGLYSQRPGNSASSGWLDYFYVLRFTGTAFVESGHEDVYFNMARDYYGVNPFWATDQGASSYNYPRHMRRLIASADNIIPISPNDLTVVQFAESGVCVCRFKLPQAMGPPGTMTNPYQWRNDQWQMFNPINLYRRRKLLVGQAYLSSTLRFPNTRRDYSFADPSGTTHARTNMYYVRVSQRLIDAGLATLGAGYVDIPILNTNSDTEIDYCLTGMEETGGASLWPKGDPGYYYRSLWAGFNGRVYIFDIHRFRQVV